MKSYRSLVSLLLITFALGGIQGACAANPKAPELVHTALRILASVYADMDAKLANQQFDRLPHENQEFQDGSGAMRDAIANEPADFKTSVLSTLEATLAAAQHVADSSKSHDAAQVKSAIDALAECSVSGGVACRARFSACAPARWARSALIGMASGLG